MDHPHRPGALKQSNKRHKGAAGNRSARNEVAGRVETKGGRRQVKTASVVTKESRLQKQRQQRTQKRMGHIDSVRNAPGKIRPRVIMLLPLSSSVDPSMFMDSVFSGTTDAQESPVMRAPCFLRTSFCPVNKQKLMVLSPERSLVSMLDSAKVADVVVLLIPSENEGDREQCVDHLGDEILSNLKFQGMSGVIGVVMGSPSKDMMRYAQRLFTTELGSDARTLDMSHPEVILRTLCSMKVSTLSYRSLRSYFLAFSMDVLEKQEATSRIRFRAYVQGTPLNVHQLLHLTGETDHHIESIEGLAETMGPNRNSSVFEKVLPDPERLLSLDALAPYHEDEQTWPTREELLAEEELKKHIPKEKGMSDYQAAWMDSFEPDEVDWETDAPGKADEDDNQSTLSGDDPKDEPLSDKEKDFEDEVETPQHEPARIRFLKYRGLQSFRTSEWDVHENLPREYNQLFAFENLEQTQARVLNDRRQEIESLLHEREPVVPSLETAEPEEPEAHYDVLSGQYVSITMSGVSNAWLSSFPFTRPIVVSSLLEHEQKMSVVHTYVQRHLMSTSDGVESKSLLEVNLGFRRFPIRPLFSENNLNCNKHRFLRSLPQEGWCMASFYGPITYAPCPALLFRISESGERVSVASGSLSSVDTSRIVLKRIIMTGYPIHCHKRTATVRYMFTNPEDVKYFKPVELSTKDGLVGHIKESLGTHGRMKCMFNGHIKGHDIVCICLYKRIFPKMVGQECISF